MKINKKTISAMATAAALLAVSSLSADAWASGGRGSRSGAPGFRSGGHLSGQVRAGTPGFRAGGHVSGRVRAGAPGFRPGRIGHPGFRSVHGFRGHPGFRSVHGFRGHPGFRSVHGFRGHPQFRGHHGGRSRVFIGSSVFLGGPVWWGAPAWGSRYVAPPVIFHQTPTVYVPPSPPPAYWYYCGGSQAYYPYVQECPGGWTPVIPAPPTE